MSADSAPSWLDVARAAWRSPKGRIAIAGAAGFALGALLSRRPEPSRLEESSRVDARPVEPSRSPGRLRMAMEMAEPIRRTAPANDIVIAPAGGALPYDY